MSTTRTAPEWRDDLPRTFSLPEAAPHQPRVRGRKRLLSTALLIPRLVASTRH